MTTPRTKGRAPKAVAPATTEALAGSAAPLTASPASRFRKVAQDGELYLLPGSGHIARLRRPGLTGLVARGTVPNPLISDQLLSTLAIADRPQTEEERIAAFKKNARGYLEVAALAFVEPKLVLDRAADYDAGEIGPDDLADRDVVWLYYKFVEGTFEEVAPFRLG